MKSEDDKAHRASFSPGQLVHHLRFDYRGVVADVDANFCGTDDWYEQVARSRPPKDAPWYHVLVDGAQHMTYVAERNLEIDASGESVSHPLLNRYFDEFREGRYLRKRKPN
jgi:heat shock protein HspQ